MKRTICKVFFVSALMLIGVVMSAQTYNLNSSTGSFSLTGSDYSGVKTVIWNINIGSLKPVKINYELDIVNNTDYVDIYAVTANGAEYMMLTLTGTEIGSISTVLPTGKAKVRFRINSGYGGNYYDGLTASFSEGSLIETTVNDNVFVNKDLFVLGKTCMGQNASNAGSLNISNTGQYGIHLASTSTNRSAYGIYSTAIGTGNNLNMYGVYSSASSSTGNVYGIYSTVSGTTGKKWAGYFNGGDVAVMNGNVGIGTTTPTEKLSLTGRLTIAPSNASPDNGYNGNMVITKPAASGQYINLIRQGQFPWSIGTVYNSNQFAIGKGMASDANFTAPYFVIDINGNVGIGTINIPANYKVAVAGKIIAEEVVISQQGSWPDFVFKPDYWLRPLHELEQFVHTNNHLPGIPTAAEVEENGLSMGEMQNLLLQKVEELTLYIIEQDKKIKSLEERLK